MSQFSEETVSDHKRLARAEHWTLARGILRARDYAHQRPWRALMLAGGSPQGEINCIRALMPKAHITAADTDQACIEAAIAAGANEGRHGNVIDLASHKFDAVCLDFCTNNLLAIQGAVNAFAPQRSPLIVNFSYGRDVKEIAMDAFEKARSRNSEQIQERIQRLLDAGIPEDIAARAYFLLGSKCDRLRSVIVYAGNEMPMCSCVLMKGGARKLSFLRLGEEDFELAVLDAGQVADLYNCPKDRIEAIRRKHVAMKAVLTRKARAA